MSLLWYTSRKIQKRIPYVPTASGCAKERSYYHLVSSILILVNLIFALSLLAFRRGCEYDQSDQTIGRICFVLTGRSHGEMGHLTGHSVQIKRGRM